MVKHAYGASVAPSDVVDRLLWRDAQLMLERHAEPNLEGYCVWCGHPWPCAPRNLAEQAEAAAFRPWGELVEAAVPAAHAGPAESPPVSPQRRRHRDGDTRAGTAPNRSPAAHD